MRARHVSWRLLFFSQVRAVFYAVGRGGKGLRGQQRRYGLVQGGLVVLDGAVIIAAELLDDMPSDRAGVSPSLAPTRGR